MVGEGNQPDGGAGGRCIQAAPYQQHCIDDLRTG